MDLRNQSAVAKFFKANKPEYVFLAAAKVGGIMANNEYKADFLYDNLSIQNNVIHQSYVHEVKKLLFLGSSCIYPKHAPQPMKEEYLLTGALEPTNEPYAIAKIAGIKMCEAYRYQYGCNFVPVMPPNLYGPNDNYDLNTSHVLPALIRKMHEAKLNAQPSVQVWGSGEPLREFMYVDDLAAACVFVMEQYNGGLLNIGSGEEISIKKLAYLVKFITGYSGAIEFDTTKPDGTMRKLMDSGKLHSMGWKHSTSLYSGIRQTYAQYQINIG